MKQQKVAFIGLGVMGYPMSGYLSKMGYETKVYNRTRATANRWENDYAGTVCDTPRDAAIDCDVVFICVGNDEDVRSVVYGPDGILSGMKSGAVLVDHTTTSAELAVELAKAAKDQGIDFIDAPVSGGQAGAENGALTVMCGGDQAVFDRTAPYMAVYAKQISLLGENGQGQRCKMVNQICIGGVLQGLSEGLLLAQKAGLNIEDVVETLKHGAAGSWQMENRAVTMAQDKFDFGFAIDWMRKDLGFCLDEADKYGIKLPLTKEVYEKYGALQARGLGRLDTSVLCKALDEYH